MVNKVVDNNRDKRNGKILNESGGTKEGQGAAIGNESLRVATADMRRRKWHRWLESRMYGVVVQARLDELEDGAIGAKKLDMGRSQRRALEREMRRYVLVDGNQPKLFFREKNGELASCIFEEDVERVLTSLHEGHGHFATTFTLGRPHGQVYWLTRAKDIGRWIASCLPCQRVTMIQKSGQLRSILQFEPMDMIGMDYVGPISPPCKVTGYSYILVVINYFSRFLWGVGVQTADQLSTMQALLDCIFPVVGWPLTVYTDNGSHFTGSAISHMWREHGVIHFPSAISHPQSVGLSERYFHMLVGRIRLNCISLGSSRDWGLEIRNAVLSINTPCIKIHGYTPAETLLGFNPVTTRKSESGLADWLKKDLLLEGDIIGLSEASIEALIDRRDERGRLATQKLGRVQDQISPRKTAGYEEPKVGDLVLLRDFKLAKDNGRKLDPCWSTPRIVKRISKSKVSAHVRQLHDPPSITKRYHFDDLLVYIPRDREKFPGGEDTNERGVVYERGAMGDIGGFWQVCQGDLLSVRWQVRRQERGVIWGVWKSWLAEG